jgi:hypothetical protein
MAQPLRKPSNSYTSPAKGRPTYQAPPQTVRTTTLTAPIEHTPRRRLTRHPPRELWQTPEMCVHCKNYGPEGDVCTTCLHPGHYYGSALNETGTPPLLARLMANAICQETDINIAQNNPESLINFFIPEYWGSVNPREYPIEDPNASKPATI